MNAQTTSIPSIQWLTSGKLGQLAIVAVGSNQPFNLYSTPLEVVEAALPRLLGLSAYGKIAVSPLYQSDPVPPSDQPKYVNGCIGFRTFASADKVLSEILAIEQDFGRQRSVPNAARSLDLDLIALGQETIETSTLELPHPRMQDRGFVLKPFADLAPDWQHPSLKKSAAQLLAPLDCSDLIPFCELRVIDRY